MINIPPDCFLLLGKSANSKWVDIFLAVLHAFIYTFFPTIKITQAMTESICTFKVCHTAFLIHSTKLQPGDSPGEPRSGRESVHPAGVASSGSWPPSFLSKRSAASR